MSVLTDEEVDAAARNLDGWERIDGALRRSVTFESFLDGIDGVRRVDVGVREVPAALDPRAVGRERQHGRLGRDGRAGRVGSDGRHRSDGRTGLERREPLIAPWSIDTTPSG